MTAQHCRWLITGASGQLGGHVVRRVVASQPGAAILALAGRGSVGQSGVQTAGVDLGDIDSLRQLVEDFQPTHVVHCGAITAVAEAYANPGRAERVNVGATAALAERTATSGGRLLFVSTDMVFDGTSAPYREVDRPCPLSCYGRTKAAAEQAAAAAPDSLVVRPPLMYGWACTSRATTFASQIAALRRGEPLKLFVDEYRTPVWVVDAARAIVELAQSELTGIIHLAGPQRLSRYEMGESFARLLGIKDARLVPVSRTAVPAAEPRPADLSLDGSRLLSIFPQLAPGPIRTEALHKEDN